MEKSVINKKISLSWKVLLGLFLLFHLLLLIFTKFTAWPEMTLWPYLIGKGWLPYKDIAIAHNPLMLIDISIFYKLFGVGLGQLKVFTWILILMTSLSIFFVTEKLANTKAALLAVLFFALWQPFFEGNGLWFDLYMGLVALVSFYFVKEKQYLWAGVFWALAFFAKQTAFWFLIPIGYAFYKDARLGMNLVKFVKGAIYVTLLFLIPALILGILKEYLYWAYEFGVATLPLSKGQISSPGIKQMLKGLLPFAPGLLVFTKTFEDIFFISLWVFAGMLGAYPRFELFHFQPAVIFLSILIGIYFSKLKRVNKFIKTTLLLYLLGSIFLFAGFLAKNWMESTRFFEEDVIAVSSRVNRSVEDNERVFIINYWDHLYVLTDTVPAVKPWVPHLSWYMEIPGIQEEMVDDLERLIPQTIIKGKFGDEGLSSYKPEEIMVFLSENYQTSEEVDGVEILTPR